MAPVRPCTAPSLAVANICGRRGFFQPAYTPLRRGYDTSFGFLLGGEDHYSQTDGQTTNCTGALPVDLSRNGVPCYGENGTVDPATASGDDARYNGFTFTAEAVRLISQHDPATPMFMYFALHNTHAPVEAPLRLQRLYADQTTWGRTQKVFNAMVSTMDESAANVTAALQRRGMWDHTLFVWSTDNGSPVEVAGSNAPLRGGKGSNWEGGTRVPCFIAGGFLPTAQRGKQFSTGMAHVLDWYTTFALLAGADPGADAARTAHLAPVESLDLWPWLSGKVAKSPRNEIVYDHRMNTSLPGADLRAYPGYAFGALRVGKWKLVVGPTRQADWYGHFTPNGTASRIGAYACSSKPNKCWTNTTDGGHPGGCYCLYDVVSDKTEHHDVSAEEPEALSQLLARWSELSKEYHPPPNPPVQMNAYCANVARHRGFVAPWLPDDE